MCVFLSYGAGGVRARWGVGYSCGGLLMFFLLPVGRTLARERPHVLFLAGRGGSTCTLLLILLRKLLREGCGDARVPFR